MSPAARKAENTLGSGGPEPLLAPMVVRAVQDRDSCKARLPAQLPGLSRSERRWGRLFWSVAAHQSANTLRSASMKIPTSSVVDELPKLTRRAARATLSPTPIAAST